MFVFAKGKPIVANIPIDRPNVKAGIRAAKSYAPGSSQDGSRQSASTRVKDIAAFGKHGPIWRSATQCGFDIGHPAVFPYALASDHIICQTNPGGIVIDPMAGSSPTLRAAADSGRQAIGIEINPEYCDLIRHRLAQSILPMEGKA